MDIFSYLHSGLSAIIPFIILLGILIFVHELGHFLVARWCGVRVEVFSLGFGKKIFQFKKGDTTYAISLIPLGGYVKMFGDQNSEQVSEEDRAVSFTHKNVYQRIAIVLAGPLMNLLFAFIVFCMVAAIGEDAKSPIVGDVSTDSQAYAAGFRPGDRIVSINQKTVTTWDDFQKSLSLQEAHEIHLEIDVKRELTNQEAKISVTAKPEDNPNILSSYAYAASIQGLTSFSVGTTIGLTQDSTLKSVGLKTGDTINSVNGVQVKYWRDFEPLLTAQKTQEPLVLDITRTSFSDGKSEKFSLTFQAPANMKAFSLAALGIQSSELFLSRVVKDSPAEAAGLLPYDRLVTINGVTLKKWEDVIENIKSFNGEKPVALSVLRDSEIIQLSITPKMTKQMMPTGVEEKRYTIGISPIPNYGMPEIIKMKSQGVGEMLARGSQKTWDISSMTVMSFVRLFQAKISPKNIGGVISIGQAASETFAIGLTQFLQMMAIISINLFILNLLPIPVLDGGHLVFYIIEMVKGAPLSIKKMEMAQQVGIAILMSLMIFALFNDFSRLLGL